MTKDRIQEFTLRVTQANSTEMIVIIYEMLLDYVEDARFAMTDKREAELAQAVRKARGCLNELLDSLHMEYEIASNLRKLYFFCIRKLVHLQAGQERAAEEICCVIAPLRDAYKEIAKLNEAGPVMDNSQTVYAGLTYGRNSLTENMADQGANRGMRV